MALRDELITGARVVVYGSGFVGCEVASTARKLGCRVTIVSPSEEPLLRQLGRTLAAEIRRRLAARGIDFRMARSIVSLVGADRLTGVVLDDGTELPADVLVEAIGSEPNTEWLAGTDLDISNGVLADSAMRAVATDGSARDDVYVVGDVARFPNPLFDDVPRRIEHWNIPTDTGKRAAQVLAARLADDGSYERVSAERFAPMPAFWSIQLDIDLQAYGLPGLGDGEMRLLEGELDGDFVAGYYRGGELVGVVGQGMKAALLPYRKIIAGEG
jgi:NADPH-dependent 2,4-dienoyl-CoA reductase/sulfur reductase-like enzyme